MEKICEVEEPVEFGSNWFCTKCNTNHTMSFKYDKLLIKKNYLDKEKVKEEIHGSILSMGKYREGKIKEVLDEFIELLYGNLDLK